MDGLTSNVSPGRPTIEDDRAPTSRRRARPAARGSAGASMRADLGSLRSSIVGHRPLTQESAKLTQKTTYSELCIGEGYVP